MMKPLMTAMKISISEVMETMFYLPVEIGEELTITQSGMNNNKTSSACKINFFGSVSGCFILVISNDLLGEITENFIGEPKEDLNSDYFSGTLIEMLNMICGNALSKIDAEIPFELSIPELVDASKIFESQLFTIAETPGSMMGIALSLQ